ncbi:MMPL family transporter [Nocardioides sp.]|uniref:MMPL family transporter n=1 Tax=Nocardioides sp. TaxID=35761 RepID=UPI002BE1DF7F|nr:MMPL family transporter [Nocardioides sp.]HXH80294.1 MMPL family transporter [Nocardioides sp.]
MSRALMRLGRFAARRPWVVIATWLVLAIVVLASAAGFGRELEDPFEAPGLDSHAASELLERSGDADMGLGADVVVTPRDEGVSFIDSAEAQAEVAEVQAAIGALPNVLGTGDPAGALQQGRQAAIDSGVVSRDGEVALVRVQYPERQDLSKRDLERLETVLDDLRESTSLQIEAGGDLHFAFEEPPPGLAEGLGLLAAVVILLLAFGSVVAMGLPIGTALFGLLVGAGSLPLVAYAVDIPAWATTIGAMVGLGVGIDYSLFVLTRFREHLAEGRSVEDAVGLSLATAGRSVVFAGGTVVVAILGLAVAKIPFVTAGGIGISWIVLMMVLASVTLLPALLGLAGTRVNGRRPRRVEGVSRGWRRWGAHVGRHAVAYTVGATVLLVAMAAPVTALRLGFPDEGAMPDARTERRAYDLVTEGFGPGANGPLVIAVDVAGDPGVLEPLVEAIAADPGIAEVSPARVGAEGIAVLVAEPTTSPQAEATQDTIARLRAEVLPDVLEGSPAKAHVGGQVAVFADLGDRVQERLPWFIAAVVLLSVLLLLVMFRSVVVPLKAALMNLLSVGAAYGVMVMVFQWGWGNELIGVQSSLPILSFIPLFMFAILFGLSMDYEVFLLSRIREEFVRTGDNDEAVVRGLAGTARTITSAALIMVAVFGSFVLGEDPLAKMMGLGLATAIAVDATIVRLVLVPASMKLLGRANWWLPGWLDRLLPGEPIPTSPVTPEAVPEPVAVSA